MGRQERVSTQNARISRGAVRPLDPLRHQAKCALGLKSSRRRPSFSEISPKPAAAMLSELDDRAGAWRAHPGPTWQPALLPRPCGSLASSQTRTARSASCTRGPNGDCGAPPLRRVESLCAGHRVGVRSHGACGPAPAAADHTRAPLRGGIWLGGSIPVRCSIRKLDCGCGTF